MKSPFPGMDPFIEAVGLFADFHLSLIGELARALSKAVPSGYLVRKGERSYIDLKSGADSQGHVFHPDVGIVGPAAPSTTATLADPDIDTESVPMHAWVTEEFRESFVEVYATKPKRELVTCIEILSPSNKRRSTKGRKIYLRKRRSLLAGSANLVEIDLLRKGHRMPMMEAWPASPYTLLVARRSLAPRCRVWPAHFVRPLPILRVPLVTPDPDITINLQALIDSIYSEFNYDQDIDYTLPLKPALTAEESGWLAHQLHQRL